MTGRVFRVRGFEEPLETIRAHSLATAVFTGLLAEETRAVDRDQAFLLGLLHDIGYVALLHEVAALQRRGDEVDLARHTTTLSQLHLEAGRAVATLWSLAPELQDAITTHHTASDELTSLLVIAESVANELGFVAEVGGTALEATSPSVVRAAQLHLGLSEEQLEAVRAACGDATLAA